MEVHIDYTESAYWMNELDLTIRNLVENNVVLHDTIEFYVGEHLAVTMDDCSLEWNEKAMEVYPELEMIKDSFEKSPIRK